jgi:sigma-54 dependent transcriptional regulator, acetoin dehydrogenase operon transcriptional activator AcoR
MDLYNDNVFSAWKKFIEAGNISEAEVSPSVLRAWKRSYEQGCSPFLMKASVLSPNETRQLLEDKKDFLQAAKPYLKALSRAAGNERHAAMLADENAIVLEIIGDEETVRDPTFPGPGTLLSEELAGANGIGSALAENDYVELIGPEHYIQGFHVYTCQGLPMKSPEGKTIGILSTSVRRIEAAERIHEILICAAHGIEADLLRIRLEKEIANVLSNYKKDERPLEELRQDIVQIQSTARLKLEMAAMVASGTSKGEKVLNLIQAAETLSSQFQRNAILWRDLASDKLTCSFNS